MGNIPLRKLFFWSVFIVLVVVVIVLGFNLALSLKNISNLKKMSQVDRRSLVYYNKISSDSARYSSDIARAVFANRKEKLSELKCQAPSKTTPLRPTKVHHPFPFAKS